MRSARRRAAVAAADAVVVALVAIAIASRAAGGFRGELLGIRISVTTTWRVLVWAAIVMWLRHLIAPLPRLYIRDWTARADAAERETVLRAARADGLSRRNMLLVAAFFIAATGFVLYPQVVAPFSIPDAGDPLLSIWRLAWVAHQLPRDPIDLFDANILYPHVRTLAFSDAMLVPAAIAAPLLWLGVHQVLAYQLLFLAAIALSGITMFTFVRSLTGCISAALVSGILFAFCAFRFLHYSHLELQMTFWMPLALLFFHRTVTTGRPRDGVLLGIVVALQGLSSLYYALFLSAFLGCLAIATHVFGYADLRRVARPLATGAVLAAALMTPIAVPYWQNRAVVGERGGLEVHHYSAVPADHLVPHRNSVYRGSRTSVEPERDLFPGVVPLALAAVGLAPPFSTLRLVYLAGLAFAVDGTFGLNGVTYPFLYQVVLPFRALRAPARFAVIVALALSVLAGFGVARLLSRVRRVRVRAAVVAAIAAIALVEARPVVSLEPIWKTAPSVYAALPPDGRAVLAEFPFPTPDEVFGPDFFYMYFSTFHWNRLVNGATGFIPEDYLTLRKQVYGFPSAQALSALRARGVEYLVLHERLYWPGEYARVTSELRGYESVTLVASGRWEGTEASIYRVVR